MQMCTDVAVNVRVKGKKRNCYPRTRYEDHTVSFIGLEVGLGLGCHIRTSTF